MGARSAIKVKFMRLTCETAEINAMAWDEEDMTNELHKQYPDAIPGTIVVILPDDEDAP